MMPPSITGFYQKGSTDTCSGVILGSKSRCMVSMEFSPPGGAPSGTAGVEHQFFAYTYGSNVGSITIGLVGRVK